MLFRPVPQPTSSAAVGRADAATWGQTSSVQTRTPDGSSRKLDGMPARLYSRSHLFIGSIFEYKAAPQEGIGGPRLCEDTVLAKHAQRRLRSIADVGRGVRSAYN